MPWSCISIRNRLKLWILTCVSINSQVEVLDHFVENLTMLTRQIVIEPGLSVYSVNIEMKQINK